jgi:hypothetical protein
LNKLGRLYSRASEREEEISAGGAVPASGSTMEVRTADGGAIDNDEKELLERTGGGGEGGSNDYESLVEAAIRKKKEASSLKASSGRGRGSLMDYNNWQSRGI